MGMEPSPPISTFLRSETSTPITIDDIQRQHTVNVEKMQKLVSELHPDVQSKLQRNRYQSRGARSKGSLPKFDEGDFVFMARGDFAAGEKLSLRWRQPCRVINALNDYV